MPLAAIDETKQIVSDLLKAHLPTGWGFRVMTSPRVEHLPPKEVTSNDLSWLIWRPEDIGDRFRYYRLELIGTSGHEFVITHGNADAGPGPAPETATVFTTWTADQALEPIVQGKGIYGPNRYGRA